MKTPTDCLWDLYGCLEVIRQVTRITCYGDRACLEDKINESRGILPTLYAWFTLFPAVKAQPWQLIASAVTVRCMTIAELPLVALQASMRHDGAFSWQKTFQKCECHIPLVENLLLIPLISSLSEFYCTGEFLCLSTPSASSQEIN